MAFGHVSDEHLNIKLDTLYAGGRTGRTIRRKLDLSTTEFRVQYSAREVAYQRESLVAVFYLKGLHMICP